MLRRRIGGPPGPHASRPRTVRRTAALGALATVAVLVLAACGSAGGSNTPKVSKNIPNVRLDIKSTPRSGVQDGGSVTWPMDSMPTQWNFNQVNGNSYGTAQAIFALLPRPTLITADNVAEPDPNYLLSWKLTKTPKQIVTYELNPKAKWSNGSR